MHKVIQTLKNIIIVVILLILGLIIGTTRSSTYAEDINYNVHIKPSLSLDIPSNTVTINLDPSIHDFDEKDLTIKVGTNNTNGFKLYVTTLNNNTNLVNTVDNTKTISNLTSSYATSAFPVNNWGYRVTEDSTTSSGNYGAFPTTEPDNIIAQSSGPINEKIATLGFGAKIDYTKPAGQYKLSLNFKAIPITTTYYMQDVVTNPSIISSICTADPTIVIDKRDEHPYMIQKLADNNCWMLDNLDLDLTNPTIVAGLKGTDETGANTNATAEALGYLKNGGGTATDQWAMSGLTYENWGDTPNYSYSQPLVNRSGSCDGTLNGDAPCIDPPIGVTDGYQGNNYTHNTIIDKYSSAGLTVTADVVYNVGPGNYKIGTLYNYCATTAGSYCYGNGTDSGSSATGNATYDICPAGWRIPTEAEYQSLRSAITNYASSNPNSLQTKLSTPFSGFYRENTMHRQGGIGYFWSSTQYNRYQMYRLTTTRGSTNTDALVRMTGISIRCLAY